MMLEVYLLLVLQNVRFFLFCLMTPSIFSMLQLQVINSLIINYFILSTIHVQHNSLDLYSSYAHICQRMPVFLEVWLY
jgi:hypothetical protein